MTGGSSMDIVRRLAACDPRPTTDDPWCFFCGNSLPTLTTAPLESDHDIDTCLWVAARRANASIRQWVRL